MVDFQQMVKTYLCDNGIRATKYNYFVRVQVLDTYINILPREDSISVVIGPMSSGCEARIAGRISDPSNVVLKNLLSLCRRARALDKCLMKVTTNWP